MYKTKTDFMTNNRKQTGQTGGYPNQPGSNQANKERDDVASFSNSRRAEETENTPENYNDDFVVEQEDEISEQEARREKNERMGSR